MGQKREVNKVTWRSQFPPGAKQRNFTARGPLFGSPGGARALLARIFDEGWVRVDGRTETGGRDARARDGDAVKEWCDVTTRMVRWLAGGGRLRGRGA